MEELTCFWILAEWEKPAFSLSCCFKLLFQTLSLPSIIWLLLNIGLFFNFLLFFCFWFSFLFFGFLVFSFDFLLRFFFNFLNLFLFLFDWLRFFFNFRSLNKMKVYSEFFDDISDGFSFLFIFNDIGKVFNDTIVSEFISKISGGNHFNESE